MVSTSYIIQTNNGLSILNLKKAAWHVVIIPQGTISAQILTAEVTSNYTIYDEVVKGVERKNIVSHNKLYMG